MTVVVTGIRELDATLRKLSKGSANKVMRPAIRKTAAFAAKQVKAAIPGRYKTVRKAIGYRMGKARYNAGQVTAKVGAGVGKRTSYLKSKVTQKDRSGRKGAGFDAANIHWWFLGTGERTTGTKRKRVGGKRGRGGWSGRATRIDTGKVKRRTGRMPPQSQPVSVILRRSQGQMMQLLRTWVANGIKKEATKLASK